MIVEKVAKLHASGIGNSFPYGVSMSNILLSICLFSAGNSTGGVTPCAGVISDVTQQKAACFCGLVE